MNQPRPPDDTDQLLRDALHAEAEGIEAPHDLLERVVADASKARLTPRPVLVTAATAALVVGVAGALLAVNDEEPVDTVHDPVTTTPEPADWDLREPLDHLFPSAEGMVRLSLFVNAEGAAAVRNALDSNARAIEVGQASADDVAASLLGMPGYDVLPTALSATFATQDDAAATRSEVSDLPGVQTTETTECVKFQGQGALLPTLVALVREDGMLMVADLQTGEQRELYTLGDPRDDSQGAGPNYVDWAELSPDGEWVYFSTCCEPATGTTYRIPIGGGEPVEVGQGAYPRVSPDGQHVAASGCQVIFVRPAQGGEGTSLDVDECVGSLAWSPDGRQLAATTSVPGDTPQVLLFDWDGASLTRADPGKPDNPGSFVSWMPDGMLNIVSGGPIDDDRTLSQDASYEWPLWVDEAGVVREQAGHESGDRPPIEGLPEALAADW